MEGVKGKAKEFKKFYSKNFVEYRNRLLVLCEDFALVGRPLSAREMFRTWKKGLRYSVWQDVAENIWYNPLIKRSWTDLEVIYTLEKAQGIYQ